MGLASSDRNFTLVSIAVKASRHASCKRRGFLYNFSYIRIYLYGRVQVDLLIEHTPPYSRDGLTMVRCVKPVACWHDRNLRK